MMDSALRELLELELDCAVSDWSSWLRLVSLPDVDPEESDPPPP